MIEKINNNYDNLTEEDFQVIGDSQELIDAFISYIVNNNKDLDSFTSITDDLMKKIFFKEEFFNYVMKWIREISYDAFLQFIYNNNIYTRIITPDNKSEADLLMSKIQDEYFDEVISRLINDRGFSLETSNLRIIQYIVDNNITYRADCIVLKSEDVSEEIEAFLLNVLKTDNSVVLKTKTPKIIQYCKDNKCFHRIIDSFDSGNLEDLELIKDGFNDDIITYEQLNNSIGSANVESSKFILQKLRSDDILCYEQIEFVKKTPSLIQDIIDLIKEAGMENDAIARLSKSIPEIYIATIKYNTAKLPIMLGGYISRDECKFFEKMLAEYPNEIREALKIYLENNIEIAKRLASNFLLESDAIVTRNVIFEVLPSSCYSDLFAQYIKDMDEVKQGILCDDIEKNQVSITVYDIDLLTKKLPFKTCKTLWKNLSEEQFANLDISFTFYFENSTYTVKQKSELMGAIIRKDMEYPSNFIDNNFLNICQYASLKDINMLIEKVPKFKNNFLTSSSFGITDILENVQLEDDRDCQILLELMDLINISGNMDNYLLDVRTRIYNSLRELINNRVNFGENSELLIKKVSSILKKYDTDELNEKQANISNVNSPASSIKLFKYYRCTYVINPEGEQIITDAENRETWLISEKLSYKYDISLADHGYSLQFALEKFGIPSYMLDSSTGSCCQKAIENDMIAIVMEGNQVFMFFPTVITDKQKAVLTAILEDMIVYETEERLKLKAANEKDERLEFSIGFLGDKLFDEVNKRNIFVEDVLRIVEKNTTTKALQNNGEESKVNK